MEHPIIFSTALIPKILDGTKTMTRRVIVPQPPKEAEVFTWFAPEIKEGKSPEGCWYEDNNGLKFHCKCPYGQVGDRLIIKEAWRTLGSLDSLAPSELDPATSPIFYETNDLSNPDPIFDIGRKRSARFMCHWMSRARLEITELRAERLWEISARDCEREGIDGRNMLDPYIKNDFRILWDSINGKRYPWSGNVWVWVISFKVID